MLSLSTLTVVVGVIIMQLCCAEPCDLDDMVTIPAGRGDVSMLQRWVRTHPAPKNAPIRLHIHLKLNNVEHLQYLGDELSDPDSSRYAQWRSYDNIIKLTAPDHNLTECLHNWIETASDVRINNIHGNNGTFDIVGSVEQIERWLRTELHVYEEVTSESTSRRQLVRKLGSHSLPRCLKGHIHLISGLSEEPMPTRRPPRRQMKDEIYASTHNESIFRCLCFSDIHDLLPVVSGASWSTTVCYHCADGSKPDSARPLSCSNNTVLGVVAKVITCPNVTVAPHARCESSSSASSYFFPALGIKQRISVVLPPFAMSSVSLSILYSDGTQGDCFTTMPQYPAPLATPQYLSKLYGIPHGMSVQSPKTTNAVVQFYSSNSSSPPLQLSRDDITAFEVNTGSHITGNITAFSYPDNVTFDQPVTEGEGSLDIQVIMSLASGAQTSYLNFDNTDWCSAFAYLSNLEEIPQVISISWGRPEVPQDAPEGWYRLYAEEQCANQHLSILATRGVTVVVASMDSGYRGEWSDCGEPVRSFPAVSSLVTAVGATQMSMASLPVCAGTDTGATFCSTPSEIVCNACSGSLITSEGGFSSNFKAPDYMKEVQRGYLQNDLAHKAFMNERNTSTYGGQRAIPDVALLGHNYPIYTNGSMSPSDGTSASAPLFAAMVTLLNDARAQVGMPPMGPINQFLYKMAARFPQMFNDVVRGDNSCARQSINMTQCPPGKFYPATLGWDATTGLGSPNFMVMLSLALDPSGRSLLPGCKEQSEAGHKGLDESAGVVAVAALVLGLISTAAIAIMMGRKLKGPTKQTELKSIADFEEEEVLLVRDDGHHDSGDDGLISM